MYAFEEHRNFGALPFAVEEVAEPYAHDQGTAVHAGTISRLAAHQAELGILAGTVRTLTYQALEKGLISKTRARNVLGVPDAEPLESEALSPAVRAPVITAGAFAARLCQLELVKKGHHLVAEEPALKGDGSFRVQLADPYGKHVGQVDIDRDGQLLSEPVFG